MEHLDNPTTVERMLLDQAKRTRTPANGSIELLPLCNMNCDMCYVRLSREEMEAKGRLIRKDEMVLHCAYVEYKGEAILFSAPSETGKTTQADLWAKHRGSRTVNGDRALLGKTGGRWTAQGWPVCGTSEVCHNESIPIRAVVMLSQAKENRAERMTPGQAFPLLYSQITVNKWNMEDHVHTLDLIDSFLREVPVYHLGCTISEEAVECLAGVMTL